MNAIILARSLLADNWADDLQTNNGIQSKLFYILNEEALTEIDKKTELLIVHATLESRKGAAKFIEGLGYDATNHAMPIAAYVIRRVRRDGNANLDTPFIFASPCSQEELSDELRRCIGRCTNSYFFNHFSGEPISEFVKRNRIGL